jgi:hypothetical protein
MGEPFARRGTATRSTGCRNDKKIEKTQARIRQIHYLRESRSLRARWVVAVVERWGEELLDL